jgi:hypothetical protein
MVHEYMNKLLITVWGVEPFEFRAYIENRIRHMTFPSFLFRPVRPLCIGWPPDPVRGGKPVLTAGANHCRKIIPKVSGKKHIPHHILQRKATAQKVGDFLKHRARHMGVTVCAFGGGVLVAFFLPTTVLVIVEAAVIVTAGVLFCCD